MSKTAYDPLNIFQSATDPTFPVPKYGDMYRNTSTGVLRIYNGLQWQDLPYQVNVAAVAPSSPVQGMIWVDTNSPGFDATAYAPGNRNAIHNGAMRVAQRGASGAGSSAASATGFSGLDRWMAFRAAFVAGMTWSQQSASLPTGFGNSLRVQRDNANAATGALWVTQTFENEGSVRFQSQPVVVSFWAKAGANFSAASGLMNVLLSSGTGTEESAVKTGGPSFTTGNTAEINQNVTLTTSWQKFTVASLGLASGLTQIALSFGFTPVGTASTNDWFEITGVQLETGYTLTPFEPRLLQQDIAVCQRYYYRTTAGAATGGWGHGYASSTTNVYAGVKLPVTMRGNPGLSTSSSAGLQVMSGAGGVAASSAIAALTSSPDFVSLQITTTGQTANTPAMIGSNSSGWIAFSAEI